MVSLYNLFVYYLNLTSTGSAQDSHSLQYNYNPKATPSKSIIKTSLSLIKLPTSKIIVPSPIPYTKKTSFSSDDQVILLNGYTPPKDRMVISTFDWELTTLEIQFKMIISFEYSMSRQTLFTYRNKVQAFLQSYESHIIQNKLTDPHTVRNLVYAISLWDKTTILKNLLKSNGFNEQLEVLMGITNRKSRVYMETYDLVYEIFENQMKGTENTRYSSDNLDIYLRDSGVAILWKQLRG